MKKMLKICVLTLFGFIHVIISVLLYRYGSDHKVGIVVPFLVPVLLPFIVGSVIYFILLGWSGFHRIMRLAMSVGIGVLIQFVALLISVNLYGE